jgi:hypothetical protein
MLLHRPKSLKIWLSHMRDQMMDAREDQHLGFGAGSKTLG